MKRISIFYIALLLSTCSLFAQIPNPNFGTWTSMGSYNIPVGWDNLNSITPSASVYTCTKASPGVGDSFYLNLSTQMVTGMGIMPGVAVSGVMDMTTFKPKSGFPCTTRPANLTGSWQYMAAGADRGHISIFMSKWNFATGMRDTIVNMTYGLPGMAMLWVNFTIPINYLSGAYPDSAIITLSASGSTPVVSSYLSVDNLAFTGSVPSEVNTINNTANNVTICPNPTINDVNIVYFSNYEKNIQLNLLDISGKVLYTANEITNSGANRFSINVSQFIKGLYLLQFTDEFGSKVEKIIIE